jgi:hypothetical protein
LIFLANLLGPGAGLFSIGAEAGQSGAPARIISAVNTAANLEHII